MSSPTTAQENSTSGVIPSAPWRIRAVTVLADLRLAVSFQDNRHGIVDCSTIRTADNPGIYAPLADPDFFAQVRLELGVLSWPNGADLDPSWLHEELISKETWSVPF